MPNSKTYFQMVAEELCAQFVPGTNYNFGDGKNGLCRYNNSINCDDGLCSKCGWNPSVERKRKRAIRRYREYREAFKRY